MQPIISIKLRIDRRRLRQWMFYRFFWLAFIIMDGLDGMGDDAQRWYAAAVALNLVALVGGAVALVSYEGAWSLLYLLPAYAVLGFLTSRFLRLSGLIDRMLPHS
jgi:hypothetical protein